MYSYEYRHRVCLEETNVVGNVYFAHYIGWQGRCREMFLHEHTPQLVSEFGHGFAMATTRVCCSYHQELAAFDEVLIRMNARAMTSSRLTMVFHYYRVSHDGEEILVAEGEQEVVCVRRHEEGVEPVRLPEPLQKAVARYMERLS